MNEREAWIELHGRILGTDEPLVSERRWVDLRLEDGNWVNRNQLEWRDRGLKDPPMWEWQTFRLYEASDGGEVLADDAVHTGGYPMLQYHSFVIDPGCLAIDAEAVPMSPDPETAV